MNTVVLLSSENCLVQSTWSINIRQRNKLAESCRTSPETPVCLTNTAPPLCRVLTALQTSTSPSLLLSASLLQQSHRSLRSKIKTPEKVSTPVHPGRAACPDNLTKLSRRSHPTWGKASRKNQLEGQLHLSDGVTYTFVRNNSAFMPMCKAWRMGGMGRKGNNHARSTE